MQQLLNGAEYVNIKATQSIVCVGTPVKTSKNNLYIRWYSILSVETQTRCTIKPLLAIYSVLRV